MSLLEIYYLLHINLVSDYEQLLDEFSDQDLVVSRNQLYAQEVQYQHMHVAQLEDEENMEEELEEDLGDGIVEDGVMPESNLESSIPYEPFVSWKAITSMTIVGKCQTRTCPLFLQYGIRTMRIYLVMMLRQNLKGICLRGNNKVVIILFHVHNRCLFLMLELY
jgi:hypothetical protein